MPSVPVVVAGASPTASGQKKRRAKLHLTPAILFIVLGIVGFKGLVRRQGSGLQQFYWQGNLAPALVLKTHPSQTAGAATEDSPCDMLYLKAAAAARPSLATWEKAAADGDIVHSFGWKASKLLNATLASFDSGARKRLGHDNIAEDVSLCAEQRQVLETELKQQLNAMFLVLLSTVEQALYQQLRAELLRRMRRKRGELNVREKLKLLSSAMDDYDVQAAELQPFFVLDSERSRAERRLSELQWGIGDTAEAKEMQQRWKLEQMRRMYSRQSQGISVSLSPGMRLMFRPEGLGNLQISSQRQVGPPHNPNEVSITVHNDGMISDVYNKKAKPSLINFQPSLGIQMSVR